MPEGEGEKMPNIERDALSEPIKQPISGPEHMRPEERGGGGGGAEKEPFVASWLVENEGELNGIECEELRNRISRLHARTKYAALGSESWRGEMLAILSDIDGGQFTEEEARDFLVRINDKVVELRDREVGGGGGRQEDGRTSRIETESELVANGRKLLHTLEQNNLVSWSIRNQETMVRLDALRGSAPEWFRLEVDARTHLHDSFVSVKEAYYSSNSSREGKTVVGGKFSEKQAELESNGSLLTARDFSVLFKEGLKGYPVAEAFIELQWAAFTDKYGVRLFQDATTENQQDQVVDKVVEGLGGTSEASKAVELAMNIAWATGQKSKWNDDLTDVDPLAEAMYLYSYRQGISQRERDPGPFATMWLPGIGASFFEQAMFPDKKYLYARPDLEIVDEDFRKKSMCLISGGQKLPNLQVELTVAQQKLLRRSRGRLDRGKTPDIVDPRQFDFMSLRGGASYGGDYGYYLGVRIPQILQVKEYLVKNAWKPEDLGPDEVLRMYAGFEYVDPQRDPDVKYGDKGVFKLRNMFVDGVMEVSMDEHERRIFLGWDNDRMNDLRRRLTRPIKKTTKMFIDRDVWNKLYGKHRLGLKNWWTNILGGEQPKR